MLLFVRLQERTLICWGGLPCTEPCSEAARIGQSKEITLAIGDGKVRDLAESKGNDQL